MLELAADGVLAIVGALCFALALFRLYQTRSKAWLTLSFAFGCNLLAQVYWVGYSAVFGETPRYFYVSELGWWATRVFIIMLLAECDAKRGKGNRVLAAWAPVAVCAILFFVFVYLAGNIPLNLIDNGTVALMGYFAVKGIVAEPDPGFSGNRAFASSVLAYVAVELAEWTASCFYSLNPTPYIVLCYALIAATAGMLACAWRSDQI